MTSLKLDAGIRAVAVALVAGIGLLASTPNVHGTVDTRGGAPCDVNKTLATRCGDTNYGAQCLYTYTRCYAVAGWRFMTCTLKSIESNGCERDQIRCFPRDDYMPSGNCTASYSATGVDTAAAISKPVRVSETQ